MTDKTALISGITGQDGAYLAMGFICNFSRIGIF